MESSVRCDVILYPKELKLWPFGKLGFGSRLSKTPFLLPRNINLKNYDSIITSPTLL